MSNHVTNGAGRPDDDRSAGAEAAREVAGSGSSTEPGRATGLPATADDRPDDRPLVSRARVRTVAAGATRAGEDADAIDRVAVVEAPAGDSRSAIGADRVEITRGGAIDVEARSVHIERGGIGAARADTVEVHQGGIGRLVATTVNVSQGGVGAARAERLTVEMGGVGAAMAGHFELSRGAARSVLAREAHLEQSFAQTVVANQVTMGRGSGALLVIGRRIEGDVRTLLDWRGALAFGAAIGLVVGLVRRGPGSRRR